MEEKHIPELKAMGSPDWYHNHGGKMQVKASSVLNDFLVIQGSAAEVLITKKNLHGCLVEWKIRHGGIENSVSGKVIFSRDEVLIAFGFFDCNLDAFEGDWLLKRFGGTVAQQCKYIRYKQFLNIPGPGTGSDGDPNVSIEITEEIKKAIKELLDW